MLLEHLILKQVIILEGEFQIIWKKNIFASCVFETPVQQMICFKKYDSIKLIFKFQMKITTPISYSDHSDSRSINLEYFLSLANIFTRQDLYVVSIETYTFDLSMQFLFSAFLNV